MLLCAAAQEDILREKWAVWSGVGMDQLRLFKKAGVDDSAKYKLPCSLPAVKYFHTTACCLKAAIKSSYIYI